MTQLECAVSFTGAVRTCGEVRAVDGLDLDITRGETVALLGRNGAGKSTAITLLLGLLEPDPGTVELFGAALNRSVRGPGGRAVLVLTAWLPTFGSYAVLSYRRGAGTV